MKFVNKLSVIGLFVLIFSFTNVAQAAPACQGTKVTACSKVKDQSQCANNYLANSDGSGTYCKWDTYCYNGGADCGTPKTCPAGYTYNNGNCYVTTGRPG
ncbi:hypothetical protein [Candidatus Methylopumilus universalis]|uniref:hypothetical protein n=1 Tax=Candidatus Methylopumilus universalis TaxID=2588536 RepID=UPI003BEEC115